MTPEEKIRSFVEAFDEGGGAELIDDFGLQYIVGAMGAQAESAEDPEAIAWAFESLVAQAHRDGHSGAELAVLMGRAFSARASAWEAGTMPSLGELWLLIVSGTVSHRQPELRHILGTMDLTQVLGERPSGWAMQVRWEAVRAMALIVRKKAGWSEVDEAIAALKSLSDLQAEKEETALSRPIADGLGAELRELLCVYHLAEAVAEVGAYLRTGSPASVQTSIQRHSEHVRSLSASLDDYELTQVGATLELLLDALVRASIWFNTSRLSEAARGFAASLASDERSAPVAELWWAQREALSQSLLDPYKTAIGIQMPTSAGKTLLAEFAIVQSLALNPAATVAYIVPTRALVNQMTRRLRADLGGATIEGKHPRVEAAVPVFELDPTEDLLLSERPEVLITTPEKLDLLVRSGHAATENLSLVVVDEAHHIAEPSRGPKLELLLATLKRERGVSCRFLLLTPFLPNAEELADWLGDSEHVAISLDWRPSQQVRAIGHWRRNQGRYIDTLEVVPSASQPSSWDGREIVLGEARTERNTRSREELSASTAAALAARDGGGVLILCGGPKKAEKRAAQVAEAMGSSSDAEDPNEALRAAVIDYVRSELGEEYPLAKYLQQRVAFHHAGLPPEVRALVEVLMEKTAVHVVAGTTTLAQGVNFPLSSVIIETLKVPVQRGQPWRDLQFSEFWNIAGRAGRALKDPIGLVVWPSTSSQQDRAFREYLTGEAANIVSALAQTIADLDDAGTEYNLALVRAQPSLSHFLQYLAHALRTAGYESATAEVEDILRSSLAFYRLRQDDREAAESLVRWSRGFLEATRHAPLLEVADVTGLSLPSVGLLAGTAPAGVSDPEYWHPDHLFGDDLTALTSVVETLAELPEMSLGITEEPGGLNAGRVAGIIRDWVAGATLPEIADQWYPGESPQDALLSSGRYLFRSLIGQIPWGLGALQLVSLGQGDDAETRDARRTPAMAYYGVNSANALAMRMVGVPRAAADGIGEAAPEFSSFSDARDWIRERSLQEWSDAGSSRGLSGEVLKLVWDEVGGSSA